jgi:hypothetical protein
MKVIVSQEVNLPESTVNKIFQDCLENLKEGRWVIGKDVMEEFATSHRYDAKVGDISEPRFRVLRAVTELEAALEERKKRAK